MLRTKQAVRMKTGNKVFRYRSVLERTVAVHAPEIIVHAL